MLFEYFKRIGTPTEFISFPDYTTLIGQEIRSFLDHNREYNPEARHVLYAANRYEHKDKLENWISQGKIVVINRYSESNIAYGAANGLPVEWLFHLESRMLRADYVFYLKISPEVSAARKKNRDRYEADLSFLKRVSSVYEALAEPGRWFTIVADQPSDLVHYEIVRTVSSLLDEKSNINQESYSRGGASPRGRALQ